MSPAASCRPKQDPLLASRVLQESLQAENGEQFWPQRFWLPEGLQAAPLLVPLRPDLGTPRAGFGPWVLSLRPLPCEASQAKPGASCSLTFLDGHIHGDGRGALQQLLVGLGGLVKQLHQEGTCLLVFAAPNRGELVELLLHQPCVIQGVFEAVSVGRQSDQLGREAVSARRPSARTGGPWGIRSGGLRVYGENREGSRAPFSPGCSRCEGKGPSPAAV